MNLIHSFTAPHGGLIAGLAAVAALALCAPRASAQYLQVGPAGYTLDADTDGSEVYRVDLFDSSSWDGNDIRLVSVMEGRYWLIDSPISLSFAGVGNTLSAFGSEGIIDGSLTFLERGLITPGNWGVGETHYLGFRREVESTPFYGLLSLSYNADRSLTLSRYTVMPGSLDIAAYEASNPIPEPATAAAVFGLATLAGAVLRRRSKQRRQIALH